MSWFEFEFGGSRGGKSFNHQKIIEDFEEILRNKKPQWSIPAQKYTMKSYNDDKKWKEVPVENRAYSVTNHPQGTSFRIIGLYNEEAIIPYSEVMEQIGMTSDIHLIAKLVIKYAMDHALICHPLYEMV